MLQFCKSPKFRLTARESQNREIYGYLCKAGQGKGIPGFKCKLCGTSFTIKSNQGIYEEYERVKAYLTPKLGPSCPEPDCPSMKIPELQVAVDRQEYIVNWNNQVIKRNTRLSSIGSADNITGYVFGMNLNFDESLSSEDVEVETALTGDYKIPQRPFRRFARLWLKKDYEESKARSKKRRKRKTVNAGEVNEEIDKHDITTRLPIVGMQVHAEYTMFGHFFHLHDLFKGVKKLTFYMDEEAGIQGACNAAFETEMLNGKCQAFVVQIKKDLTVNERRRAIRDALRNLRHLGAHYSPFGVKISYDDIARMHLEDQIKSLRSYYRASHEPVDWENHRVGHPLPRMNEPDKIVNYISEQPFELAPDELAELFYNATLGGIDRFFMQVRRKLSPLEAYWHRK